MSDDTISETGRIIAALRAIVAPIIVEKKYEGNPFQQTGVDGESYVRTAMDYDIRAAKQNLPVQAIVSTGSNNTTYLDYRLLADASLFYLSAHYGDPPTLATSGFALIYRSGSVIWAGPLSFFQPSTPPIVMREGDIVRFFPQASQGAGVEITCHIGLEMK